MGAVSAVKWARTTAAAISDIHRSALNHGDGNGRQYKCNPR